MENLLREQEKQQTSTSSFEYGKQIQSQQKSDGKSFEYGKQMTSSNVDGISPALTGKTETPSKVKVYNDQNEQNLVSDYEIKKTIKSGNKLEIDFGNFKMSTDCTRLLKGDSSFDYSGTKKYSKDLAKIVGEKFGCKFKS